MVVEDERPLAQLVGEYLTRDGFEVTTSHDGAEAVTVAREVDACCAAALDAAGRSPCLATEALP